MNHPDDLLRPARLANPKLSGEKSLSKLWEVLRTRPATRQADKHLADCNGANSSASRWGLAEGNKAAGQEEATHVRVDAVIYEALHNSRELVCNGKTLTKKLVQMVECPA